MSNCELEFVRHIVERLDGIDYRMSLYRAKGYWLVLWECPACDPSEPCLPISHEDEIKALDECLFRVLQHHHKHHSRG